jgi:hypothetical protein
VHWHLPARREPVSAFTLAARNADSAFVAASPAFFAASWSALSADAIRAASPAAIDSSFSAALRRALETSARSCARCPLPFSLHPAAQLRFPGIYQTFRDLKSRSTSAVRRAAGCSSAILRRSLPSAAR